MTTYTRLLSSEQTHILREILDAEGYEFSERPYSFYHAAKSGISLTVYEKGPKIVVQGKDTEDFVKFLLEPRVLGQAELGYEEQLNPEMFQPHFGIDESGKGDFFGPLVIAGVFTDREITRQFQAAGIQDSKNIKSDAKIRVLAETIRNTAGVAWEVVCISPKRYNEMYASFANLNKLLAWGHAKIIECLHARRPDCCHALSDQFANPRELESALGKRGVPVLLKQRTKAESDIAVAAASILARACFIDWLRDTGLRLGTKLPRGASQEVKDLAGRLAKEHGEQYLGELGKLHFKGIFGASQLNN